MSSRAVSSVPRKVASLSEEFNGPEDQQADQKKHNIYIHKCSWCWGVISSLCERCPLGIGVFVCCPLCCTQNFYGGGFELTKTCVRKLSTAFSNKKLTLLTFTFTPISMSYFPSANCAHVQCAYLFVLGQWLTFPCYSVQGFVCLGLQRSFGC